MYYTNSYNANLDVWDGSQLKQIKCVRMVSLIDLR